MRSLQFLLCSALLLVSTLGRGQYFQFSQYNFSVQRVNPAWVGLSRDAMVDFSYRNQKTGGDFKINSNFLSVAYPFFNRSTGRPWSGLGISVMSDKSGPLFKSQEAAATFAVNISTGRYQSLSLGFKGLLRWQRINYDGLYTGSQYIEGHGFSPALDNGEVPQPFQNKFFTLSSGLLWQQTDRKGKLLKQFSFSFFDFNKPNPTFLDGSQDELPSTFIAHGSWLVYRKKQLGVVPEFLLTRSSTKSMLMAGGKFQYDLNKLNSVDLLLKYAVGRSGIVGLQLHKENFSIGISYDFPVGAKNVANLGAMEVGLEYRTPVDLKSKRDAARKMGKKKKSTVTKRKNTPVKKPSSSSTVTAKTPTSATDTGTTKQIKESDTTAVIIPSVQVDLNEIPNLKATEVDASAGSISHEPLLVEKITLHFRFDYNSTDLDEETEKFLDELSETLKGNDALKVILIGHTDNIGSPHLNSRLSLKRAEAVRNYLLKSGVDANRISTDGKGMNEPLNGNRTDEERAFNRRVEIKLISSR
jgi:type IX secretion system PorP/SprF family membrane protein